MPVQTLTARTAATPAEWLLARYERLRVRPSLRRGNHERPIFELVTDEPRLFVAASWSADDTDFDELGETA